MQSGRLAIDHAFFQRSTAGREKGPRDGGGSASALTYMTMPEKKAWIEAARLQGQQDRDTQEVAQVMAAELPLYRQHPTPAVGAAPAQPAEAPQVRWKPLPRPSDE